MIQVGQILSNKQKWGLDAAWTLFLITIPELAKSQICVNYFYVALLFYAVNIIKINVIILTVWNHKMQKICNFSAS